MEEILVPANPGPPGKWSLKRERECTDTSLAGKCNSMECYSYKGINLLQHTANVVKSVLDKTERQMIMQFGFMPHSGTTDAILGVRQMHKFSLPGNL